MSRTLSSSSSVEVLRREAKRWLKSMSAGDAEAVIVRRLAFAPTEAVGYRFQHGPQALVPEILEPEGQRIKVQGVGELVHVHLPRERVGRGRQCSIRTLPQRRIGRVKFGVDVS